MLILRRLWIPVLAASICALAAFLIGTSTTLIPFSMAYASPAGVPLFFQQLFLAGTVSILIAIFVAEAVERATRLRTDNEIARLERESRSITETSIAAVARNVFGTFHSEEVLSEAISSIFSSPLLREEFLQEITFYPCDDDPECINLKQMIEYSLINTSSLEAPFEQNFALENTSLFYPHKEAIGPSTLTYVKVGDDIFDDERLATLRQQIKTHRLTSGLDIRYLEIGKYSIPPKGRVHIRLEWRSVEPIDSYFLLRMFIPTKKISVVVRNECGAEFLIKISSLFRDDFSAQESLGAGYDHWQWKFDGVVLPFSGWLLRWNDIAAK